MNGDPLVSARVRQIESAAAARRAKRAEEAAKLAERKANEESRVSISPRDLELQAQAKANWDYSMQLYEQDQLRKYHTERRKAIAEMARLKDEWDQPETTPMRRGQIVRMYGELYRKFEDDKTRKPTTTSDETILAYWQNEKRKAALAKIYVVPALRTLR